MKNAKGITLIALVITIVVLIILAGVAISLSIGENGIFNRARTAKEQYQNAQDYEQIETAKLSNQIDSYVDANRAGNTSNNYSLNEKVVGTWIDGKAIYQKTYVYDQPVTNDSSVIIDSSITKNLIDTFIGEESTYRNSAETQWVSNPSYKQVSSNNTSLVDYGSYRIIIDSDGVKIIPNGTWSNPIFVFSIKYTKK